MVLRRQPRLTNKLREVAGYACSRSLAASTCAGGLLLQLATPATSSWHRSLQALGDWADQVLINWHSIGIHWPQQGLPDTGQCAGSKAALVAQPGVQLLLL